MLYLLANRAQKKYGRKTSPPRVHDIRTWRYLAGGEAIDPQQSPDSISRRRLLKRIGAGAAIAWTAPVLTSLRTPAFGQATPICTDQDFVCDDPDSFVLCGTGNNDLDCFCEKGSGGQTICANDLFCDDARACASDGECPPDWICASNTCCPGGVCLPPCGQAPVVAQKGRARRSRRSASGR